MSSTLRPLFTWRSAVVESDLSPTTRHVLLTLSLHMNERGGSCFPSTRLLARETGLSRRSVETHLGAAVEASWLDRQQREKRSDGRFTGYTYRAVVPHGNLLPTDQGNVVHEPWEPDDTNQGKEVPRSTSVNSPRSTGPERRPLQKGGGAGLGKCPDCKAEIQRGQSCGHCEREAAIRRREAERGVTVT